MELSDKEFIMRMLEVDSRLKRLYLDHEKKERELALFERRMYLTPEEQVREKKLKFEKLRGKEKLMEIVSELRYAA